MIQRFLLASFAMGLSLSMMGGTSAFEYTYMDSEAKISAIGNKVAETIDVAIKIDNPAMAGMKVKKITAYTNTVSGLSNTSVWLSKSLSLKDDVNVPDILSANAPVISSQLYGEEAGAIEYTFDDPYELTSEPVYIGYSLTVDKADDMGTNYPVLISKVLKENSMYLHTSDMIPKWEDYSSNGAAAIVVTIAQDDVEYSLGITEIKDAYSASEEDFFTYVTLCNTGANPIKKFTYQYSFDDGNMPVIAEYEFEKELVPDLFNFTKVKLPFECKETDGEHVVNFNITEVNGIENPSQASEASFNLEVMPFIPVHRPLVEEYTGLWCGYCPKGYIAMEYVNETFGDDQVTVCFHNKDLMTVTDVYPMPVTSFPNASVDRKVLCDPYFGTTGNQLGILEDVEAAIDEVAFASIDVKASLEGDDVNVAAEVVFNKDFETSPYIIGYILTCNGLTGENWAQKNFYHNNGTLKDTPLAPLAAWPSNVFDLVYNDVPVNVKGMSGVAESLPANVNALETYTHNFNYNIEGNTLVQNRSNLVVNAFIVNTSNGRIMNANKCKVVGDAGMGGIEDDAEVKSIAYYNFSGIKVENPGKGMYIRVKSFKNGKTLTEKVKI